MDLKELDSYIKLLWRQGKSKADILYEIIAHVIVFIYELEIEDL